MDIEELTDEQKHMLRTQIQAMHERWGLRLTSIVPLREDLEVMMEWMGQGEVDLAELASDYEEVVDDYASMVRVLLGAAGKLQNYATEVLGEEE